MMRPVAAATEYTPIFDWSPPRGRKLSLISFITASAVLHALCFYVFQIIYPPTVALLPPPARVNVINAGTEEGRVLLRWIEAEDPALSSTTQRPPDATALALPKVEHVPSYVNRQPALKQLPPYQPDLRIPSAQPPGPVRASRAATPPLAAPVPSRLTFADPELLGAPVLPQLKFQQSTKEPPQSAQFRIEIDAHGAVRYCFLESSSGDPALDEQARQALMLCRFPAVASQGSALWTTATIEWGNDLAPSGTPAGSTKP